VPEVSSVLASNGAEPPTAPTDVERVFQAWASTRDHPNAVKLTDDRRRLIAKQLKVYPVGDLEDAVRGWTRSPFHTGQNEQGTTYNDLALMLRDADHVEKFRDLWRNGPGHRVVRDPIAEAVKARIADRHRGQAT
jgi:hypothetical protein